MGVYADDHSDRYKLPELAVKRAKALLNLDVKGREVVIIGDTVHDILCGKSIFARSIAVGTGRGSNREDLLNSSPDFFLADLSNTSNLLKAILSD